RLLPPPLQCVHAIDQPPLSGPVSERCVRPDRVVLASPTLDDDLGLACDPRRSHRTRHDCAAPAAAGCKLRWSARAYRAWAADGGPSAPRVARYARPACR